MIKVKGAFHPSHFLAAVLALVVMVPGGTASASDVSAQPGSTLVSLPAPVVPKSTILSPDTPQNIIGQLLSDVQSRNRDRAFAKLSDTAQERYGGDARVFMNRLRLTQHALYDHANYKWVGGAGDETQTIQKITLTARDGKQTLLIVRLVRPNTDNAWVVDGLTVVADPDARGA